MTLKQIIIFLVVIFHCSYAPPVTQDKLKKQDSEITDLVENMEYHIYLKEVMQALESDLNFIERLRKADEGDVLSGKFAKQLDFVNQDVRTKLNEIKRRELERLRHMATKQFELVNEVDIDEGKVALNDHLDHANTLTFEIEDLKKLIKKTASDLATDRERKQQLKENEMQKEFEKRQKTKQEEDSKKRPQSIYYPGSKQQMEEVWKKQDHMDKLFDPKLFFVMYDVDGDGVWDDDEVKAFLIKEVNKVNVPGGPNKDLHERAKEMERMREQVFKTYDTNRDGVIDLMEFLVETWSAEFNQDEGWKPNDENQIYTRAEYKEFENRKLEELRYLQRRQLANAYGGIISIRLINNGHSLGHSNATNSSRIIRKAKNHLNMHQELKFRHKCIKNISNTRRDNPHTGRRNSMGNRNIRVCNRRLRDNIKLRINSRNGSVKVCNSRKTKSRQPLDQGLGPPQSTQGQMQPSQGRSLGQQSLATR